LEEAAIACQDPFVVEWIDESEDYGEERISFSVCIGAK
jgi:hypothetical protein